MADITVTTDFSQVNNLNSALNSTGDIFNKVVDRLLREQKRAERVTKAFSETTKANLDLLAKAEIITTNILQAQADKREKARQKEAEKAEKEAKRIADANQKIIDSEVKRRAKEEQAAANYAQNFQGQVGGNLGLGARGISAGASAGAFEAEIERLRQKYDQIYASSQLYERSLQELNKAHALGVMSAKQHEAAVEQLNLEYQQFSNAAEGATLANNRFSQHVNESGRGMNKFGMYAQQVGYQVGDFFVQIQSGTNVLVAFGQQATQLAGLIPGVWGAALGIGISLATALGAAFMRTSEGANTSAESLKAYQKALEGLNTAITTTNSNLEGLRRGIDDENILSATVAIDALKTSLATLRSAPVEGFSDVFTRAGRIAEEQALKVELEKQLEVYKEQLAQQQKIEAASSLRAKDVRDQYRQEEAIKQAHADQVKSMGQAQNAQRLMTIAATDALDKYGKMRTVAAGIADEMARAAANTQAAANAALTAMSVEFSTAGGAMSQYGGRGTSSDRPITNQYGDVITLPGSNRPRGRPTDIDFGLPDVGRGGGGGAGTTTLENKMEEIYKYLELDKYLVEQETIAFEQRQEVLRSALENKMLTLQEYNELEKALALQHQQDLANIEGNAQQQRLSDTANMFGQLANIAAVGGQKTAKAVATFQAVEGTINAYGAAIKALNTPGITLAGRFAAYASVLAAGLRGVMAIRSAGGVGGGSGGVGGGGSPGSATVAQSAAPASPQTVLISGLDPDALFTGEQLSRLFENFYKENDNRGKVFVVAR